MTLERERERERERAERYEFTWPDKRKFSRLANTPTTMTLRPCREESVDFDHTQNLYIEGDNLEVLKIIRNTYLNKIKMIYIDPPYNTGNDFIYRDKFKQDRCEYIQNSAQQDENGNNLVQNKEINGRFHTDWLNMIYPRLKVARELLSENGTIFISIDDHEFGNLQKVCDEIFGEGNHIATINWKGRGGRQDSKYFAAVHEYILCYAKDISKFEAGEEIKSGDIYPKYDEKCQRFYKTQLLRKWGSNSLRDDRPNLFYPIAAPDGTNVYPIIIKKDRNNPSRTIKIEGRWRWEKSTMLKALHDNKIEFVKTQENDWIAYEKIYAPIEGEKKTKKYITWIDDISNGTDTLKQIFGDSIFDYSKSPELISKFIKMSKVKSDDIILDFFSGSASTAHAVLNINIEDKGSRRFIMVQFPQPCSNDSVAYKQGYKDICKIGKERIRRVGKNVIASLTNQTIENFSNMPDIGFRVLKLSSSNMENVYYSPEEFSKNNLFADNIKTDRTPEDLLFQVMLELGIELSASIESKNIEDSEVFFVNDNYLITCFDSDIQEAAITAIAKLKPYYFVLHDALIHSDSIADNFDQIFAHYSPDTIRKVI